MNLAVLALVGAAMGFLGGALGKGGSALATPVLFALGVPAAVAVAAPLPSTIPSTITAGRTYARAHEIDAGVLRATLLWGVPATVAGAVLTRWIDATALVRATDVLLVAVGLRILLAARRRHATAPAPVPSASLTAGLAVGIGLVSGLLANSGGFLLAPLYLSVLHLPVKRALGTSLAAAAVLALPATVVHAALGHLDWRIVAVLACSSVPFARLGARLSVGAAPQRLETVYGAALALFGAGFLVL